MSIFPDAMNVQGDLYGTPANPGPRYASRGSRAEMEKHFRELPANVKSELRNGKLRLGDEVIYSIKPVGPSTTIKLFETQDDKEIGLRNISNAKLSKNQALMVSGIYLLAGIAPAAIVGSPTPDEIKATEFGSIGANNLGALANGEFSLKANKVTLVPETSNRVFVTDNNHNWPLGFYKLHNPRPIQDDVLIELTLELGTVTGIPQDTFVFVGLAGTITTP